MIPMFGFDGKDFFRFQQTGGAGLVCHDVPKNGCVIIRRRRMIVVCVLLERRSSGWR